MIDIQKRIFITGATGFIGANLVHQLLGMGAKDVHILVRAGSDLSRIESVKDSIIRHDFSLNDREKTFQVIGEISPQVVYHIAAAGTAVGRAPLTLEDLMRVNFIGSMNLIDAVSETGTCECFIHTGSSSEYGLKDLPMSEYDVLEPNNFYGISKASATHYAAYLGRQKHFPIATYRIFSAYGPFEDTRRLIPTLLRSYGNRLVPELSSPLSVRDFIYVGDIVNAYLEGDKAITVPGDIINLGTGNQQSIADVVKIIQKITDFSGVPSYGGISLNQLEPRTWVADITKMKNILELVPTSLDVGLTLTLQWMRHTV